MNENIDKSWADFWKYRVLMQYECPAANCSTPQDRRHWISIPETSSSMRDDQVSMSHNVWYKKSTMARLSDSKKRLTICFLVSIQHTNVADEGTEKQTPHDGVVRQPLPAQVISTSVICCSINLAGILADCRASSAPSQCRLAHPAYRLHTTGSASDAATSSLSVLRRENLLDPLSLSQWQTHEDLAGSIWWQYQLKF